MPVVAAVAIGLASRGTVLVGRYAETELVDGTVGRRLAGLGSRQRQAGLGGRRLFLALREAVAACEKNEQHQEDMSSQANLPLPGEYRERSGWEA